MTAMTGGCACGKMRYTAEVADDDAYLCHCRLCQRATGNVSLALKSLKREAVRWDSEPDRYASSPIATRAFCAACGTSLGFAYNDGACQDLTVASFDDPSRFEPRYHFGTESVHRAWIDTEGLKESRSDQYQPLNDRWMTAIGKLPD